MKKLLCKIIGHNYKYNFTTFPTKCHCTRCGKKWKSINNPAYIPNVTSPLDVDLYIWVEDKKH